MKLPKNYFENLSATKYREYLKLLPSMKKESTRAITMLIFTFLALSILGIFAINPTLTTIIDLNKQLEESEFVHQELTKKMDNLSTLQQKYNLLGADLTIVYNAIPKTASVPTVIGQIQALAAQKNVKIISIRVSEVQLFDSKNLQKNGSSFTFSLETEGSYETMTNFAKSLANFNRIVNIETIILTKNDKRNVLILTIKGREYFND